VYGSWRRDVRASYAAATDDTHPGGEQKGSRYGRLFRVPVAPSRHCGHPEICYRKKGIACVAYMKQGIWQNTTPEWFQHEITK
jgi:hypothetical protein